MSSATNATERVAYSPSGRLLVSGSTDGSVCVWDAGTGRLLRTLTGEVGAIRQVTFSPDGKRLLGRGAGKGGAEVHLLWDTGTGKVLLTLPGLFTPPAFSSDWSRVAVPGGAKRPTVTVRDTDTGRVVRTLPDPAIHLALNSNGTRLVVGGSPVDPGHEVPLADGDSVFVGAWSRLTLRHVSDEA